MAEGEKDGRAGDKRSVEPAAEMALEEAREQFLLLAAHDLRTPLTTMRLTIDAWRKGLAEGGHAYLRDLLSRNLAKAELHVEELAYLNRLRSTALALRAAPVAIDRLVQEVINTPLIQGLALGIKLEYSFAALPPIMADEPLLRQAIVFILAQALERLETAQVVHVAAEEMTGGVGLRIRDNSPAQRLPLVEILAALAAGRISPLTRAGWYAAFRIVQAHGGVLRAEGSASGCTICLWLPAHLPSPPFSASMRKA
ncbi:MAG: HAMP domain-containing histidine kinase [Planctomycetota bacterium]|nr:HAMP domain-containing histidine kinase [Planctomycetota bacterium]